MKVEKMAKKIAFVIVNTPDDYLTRKSLYEQQGYSVKPARPFDEIKIDLQDYNGSETEIVGFRAFLATK